MVAKPKLKLNQFSALAQAATGTETYAETKVSLLYSEKQIRLKFANLEQMAESIKRDGLMQPIVVHAESDGRFRIIAGERRFRAAQLAELQTVPTKIVRDLDEIGFRRLQITENVEREGLTPYEEAMGVIEDVNKYGFAEACSLWNRSESWISKRVAVGRLPEIVKGLLQDELCGDLEILNSLAQLLSLNPEKVEYFVQQFKNGLSVSRLEVRDAVILAKEWSAKHQPQVAADSTAEPEQSANEDSVQIDSDPDQGIAQDNSQPLIERSHDAGVISDQQSSTSTTKSEKTVLNKQTKKPKPLKEPSEREQELVSLREEIFEAGTLNLARLQKITEILQDLNYGQDDSEWVQLSALLDTLLPLLRNLGKTKSNIYLRKIQEALKKQSADELYNELHPLPKGQKDDIDRKALASKPSDWN